MKAHLKLGRIFGIEVGLHLSWFIIALLVMFSLAGQFYLSNPGWGGGVIWASAIVTGILFFATLLIHELSHAIVARSRGLPVRGITLFALGGVAQIEKDAADAKTEFLVGIVGPVTSALIGAVCLGLAWDFGWTPSTTAASPVIAVLVWLGYINLLLAAFNMIPGFPLDGGRILRAVIQASDPRNPLGKLKIPLGDAYLIHQADRRSDIGRLVSHGCVRMRKDDIFDLAEKIITAHDLPVSGKQLANARKGHARRVVQLNEPLPVDINYDTLVVEARTLHIYPDVYKRGTNSVANLRAELEAEGVHISKLTDRTLKSMLTKANPSSEFVVNIADIENGRA